MKFLATQHIMGGVNKLYHIMALTSSKLYLANIGRNQRHTLSLQKII